MAEFEKGMFQHIRKLPEDTEMVPGEAMPIDTDAHQFNRVSLRQLDDHIDEIIRQNPDWMLKLEQIINATKEDIDERSMGRKVSSKDS